MSDEQTGEVSALPGPSRIDTSTPEANLKEKTVQVADVDSQDDEAELTKARAILASRTQPVVDRLLEKIDALPVDPDLTKLRTKLIEMYTPEKTELFFLSSGEFRNIVMLAIERCAAQPHRVKVHVREVIDNMNQNKPKTKLQREKIKQDKKRRIDSKRSSETLIERLHLTFEAITQKIRSVERREVSDEEDEEDLQRGAAKESHYVYLDRLYKRAVQLYRNIQQVEGNSQIIHTESTRPIVVRCTNYPEINRAAGKMATRGYKRGTTPDYCDVLIVVKRISEQENLGMSEDTKRSVATTVFKEIIDLIKTRRVKDVKRNLESLEIELEEVGQEDPANADETLRETLKKNGAEAEARIDSVIEKYSNKQTNGGLDSDDESEGSNDEGNGDGDGGAQGNGGTRNETDDEESDRETDIDESYLDTGSSEDEEEREETDLGEMIKRFGQERERPRPHAMQDTTTKENLSNGHTSSNAPTSLNGDNASSNGHASSSNGCLKRSAPDDENESDSSEKKVVVIELSESEAEEATPASTTPYKRIIPKRLMTLGSTPPREDPQNDDEKSDDGDENPSQEVIEISD